MTDAYEQDMDQCRGYNNLILNSLLTKHPLAKLVTKIDEFRDEEQC